VSAPQFTPGPWRYGDEDERIVGGECVDIHAGEYCTPSYRSVASAESPFIDGEFCPLDEESRANARLIAAAPELYSTLEHIRELLVAYGPRYIEKATHLAEAVLAKARGEA
jgi:hypothetical protein